MFPVMLALVTMIITVGLRFLTGDAGIDSAFVTSISKAVAFPPDLTISDATSSPESFEEE